jgi:hypothetical protein
MLVQELGCWAEVRMDSQRTNRHWPWAAGHYLGGCSAGQMNKLPNPGCSTGVTGADQHWSTNFHGMPVAGGL